MTSKTCLIYSSSSSFHHHMLCVSDCGGRCKVRLHSGRGHGFWWRTSDRGSVSSSWILWLWDQHVQLEQPGWRQLTRGTGSAAEGTLPTRTPDPVWITPPTQHMVIIYIYTHLILGNYKTQSLTGLESVCRLDHLHIIVQSDIGNVGKKKIRADPVFPNCFPQVIICMWTA